MDTKVEWRAMKPFCACSMFSKHGICWHTGYNPNEPIWDQVNNVVAIGRSNLHDVGVDDIPVPRRLGEA